MKAIQSFDVFPKFDRRFEQDARRRTAAGGIFSIVAIVIIILLVVSEVRYFFSETETQHMYVDPEMGGTMPVKVNISFHRVPCDLIALDAVDAFGNYAEDVSENAVKTRVAADSLAVLSAARKIVHGGKASPATIDSGGNADCPTCYGAEANPGDCCHTCDDVRDAYARKRWQFNVDDISIEQCAEERLRLATLASSTEGCNIHTTFTVSRVTGNLHFVPGRIYQPLGQRVRQFLGTTARQLNLSHVIHTLEFGEHFPGQVNPLDGAAHIRGTDGSTGRKALVNGRFSYFVKIVPTRYQVGSSWLGTTTRVDSNQYSVTRHFTPSAEEDSKDMVPGIFIVYDLSPIKIQISRTHPYPSVLHFVLQLCAVCGGVLTVAGIVDALLYHGARRLKKAREGKLI